MMLACQGIIKSLFSFISYPKTDKGNNLQFAFNKVDQALRCLLNYV